MICTNGNLETPIGENILMLICQMVDNKGSFCRFSKFCDQTQEIVMTTDRFGNSCKNYTTKKVGE